MNPPKRIVAVSAYVTNGKGETLLVKTYNRSDTWKCPGGQVEDGEALDQAVCREVLEEIGIRIKLLGITGVYYNAIRHILSVFKAEYFRRRFGSQS